MVISILLVLVEQQSGFQVPGEEPEDAENAGAAEEVPYDPDERELCAEGELGGECPCGCTQDGKEGDMLLSEEPASNQSGEDEKWQGA